MIDPVILDYYDRTPEETRLGEGAFRLEEARPRELIRRFAPRPPGVVLDVGGAAGPYALWLADSAARPLASCEAGDARALAAPDRTADLVLLLGPLYHLTEAHHRKQALREAARVLRPGGCLLAAGISRWASALDGLARDLLGDPAFLAIVQRDLQDGQHRNPTDRPDYFTTAYFHRPDELAEEMRSAGLMAEGVYGIEGPGWMLQDIGARMGDPERREALLRVARMLESEPSVIGSSAHLLAVGRRPREGGFPT